MKERSKAAIFGLVCCVVLYASGIAPALIPNNVNSANKRGNSNVFQLAANNSAAAAGSTFCDDGNGNATTSGCSGGGAGTLNPSCTFNTSGTSCAINVAALNVPSADYNTILTQCWTGASTTQTAVAIVTYAYATSAGNVSTVTPAFAAAAAAGYCAANAQGSAGPAGATGATGGGGSSISAGSITSLPGTPSSGQLYLPTDSLYPHLLYTGAAWQYFYNGATLTPPSGTFAWTNQVSATVSQQTNGIWSFAFPGSGGSTNEVNVFDAATPSLPFTQVYRFTGAVNNASNGDWIGVSLRESGTGKLLIMGLFGASADCVVSNTTVAQLPCFVPATYTAAAGGTGVLVGSVGAALIGGAGTNPACVKVTVASAANGLITLGFSTDNGLTFTTLYSVAKTTAFTVGPDHVGVAASSTFIPTTSQGYLTLLGIN